MKTIRSPVVLTGLIALAPVLAQEPVVVAADPEKLFTDADPVLHANKQVVLHVVRELIQCGWWEQADRYLSQRYIQHHPAVRSGRDNIVAFFSGAQRTPTCDKLTMPIVSVLTSGDVVGVVFRLELDHPDKPGTKYTTISYDQWRIVDGKADEHWDTSRLGEPPAQAQ